MNTAFLDGGDNSRDLWINLKLACFWNNNSKFLMFEKNFFLGNFKFVVLFRISLELRKTHKMTKYLSQGAF